MGELSKPFPGRRRSIVRARTDAAKVEAEQDNADPITAKSSLHRRTERGRCPRCGKYIGKGIHRHLEFCREGKHVNVW